ncbi:Retrotransposon gag protein [Melia azedarach]|uniref:Retrotransposon gag protein n=1 Tax=Melia azedarach TaxID=155640 RepID=A0ACC1X1B3_MELAZ|nr:Retrotransposon gag protein [Melia azedarach]
MSEQQDPDLYPIDPEIERTFRRRRREQRVQAEFVKMTDDTGVVNGQNAMFELKPVMFQMLQTVGQFSGMPTEDPYLHLRLFIEMETFYNGLNAHTRMVVDASTNGAILAKSYNEAYEILERISNNNYQWPTTRAYTGRKMAGIHEVDTLTSLAAEVSSMSNMLKTISMGMRPQIGQLAERDQAIKRALQRNFTKPIPQFPDIPMDILGPWTATASPEDVPSEEESDN